jgi:hypothetical protein
MEGLIILKRIVYIFRNKRSHILNIGAIANLLSTKISYFSLPALYLIPSKNSI